MLPMEPLHLEFGRFAGLCALPTRWRCASDLQKVQCVSAVEINVFYISVEMYEIQ